MKYLGLILCLSALIGCDTTTTSTSRNNGGGNTPSAFTMNDTGQAAFSLCAPSHADIVYASNDPNQVLSASADASCPAQDASLGRDVDNLDDSDGFVGFSFLKRDNNGNTLTDQNADFATQAWSCVYDMVTGLSWEVKTANNSDLQWSGHRYTWYNSDNTMNGGDPGVVGSSASCTGVATCDTQSYIAEINRIKLCGYSDWRLPRRAELRSIIDYGLDDTGPMVDSRYFPNASNIDHWTAETSLGTTDGSEAWEIHLKGGYDEPHEKGSSNVTVMLVRGPS